MISNNKLFILGLLSILSIYRPLESISHRSTDTLSALSSNAKAIYGTSYDPVSGDIYIAKTTPSVAATQLATLTSSPYPSSLQSTITDAHPKFFYDFDYHGNTLVTLGGNDLGQNIKKWNILTGTEIAENGFPKSFSGTGYIALSNDGTKIAASSWQYIYVYNISDGSQVGPTITHSLSNNAKLKWAPTADRLLATAEADSFGLRDHKFALYNINGVNNPKLVSASYGSNYSSGNSPCGAWSPDSSFVAVQIGKYLRVYSGIDGSLKQSKDTGIGVKTIHSIDWSPSGNKIAIGTDDTSGSHIYIFNDSTNEISIVDNSLEQSYVYDVAWSPDATKLVTVSAFSTPNVKVWDNTGTLLKNCAGHSGIVRKVVWSPNGNYFATGSDDNKVKIWDVSNNYACVYTGSMTNDARLLLYPSNSRVICGSTILNYADLRIWETSEVTDTNTNNIWTNIWNDAESLIKISGGIASRITGDDISIKSTIKDDSLPHILSTDGDNTPELCTASGTYENKTSSNRTRVNSMNIIYNS